MNKKHYFLISIVLVVFLSLAFYYSSIFTIYGKIRVVVLDQEQNPVDSMNILGVEGFNSTTKLPFESNSYMGSEVYFFKELVTDFSDYNSDTMLRLKVYDKSEQLICDTLLASGKVHCVSSFKTNYTLIDKFFYIALIVTTSKAMIAIYFVVIISLIFYTLYRKINRHSFIVLCISFAFGIVPLVLFAYYYQFRSISGFFVISSILLFLVALIIRKPMSPKRKNFVLILSSSFFSILLVELILRISGLLSTDFEKRFGYYESVSEQNLIKPFWTHKENYDYYLQNSEFRFKRRSNSIGLSGDEPKKVDTSEEKLILALGDSFTEGDGAHKDSTWLKFLERKLLIDGFSYLSFINAGVCGSDPVYEYELLNKKLLEFKPDIVIVSFGNELTDLISRGGNERFETMQPALQKHWWEPIYIVSHLSRLVIHYLCGYNDLLIQQNEFEQRKLKALNDLKNAIDNFEILAKNEGFKLVIVFYPLKHEVMNKSYDYNDELFEYARGQKITCIDLMSYYLKRGFNADNINQYYWELDGHHKAAGYEVYADGVYTQIRALID